MFTLKFMRGEDCTVACGQSYDVYHHFTDNIQRTGEIIGATVSVYPGLTSIGGVEFHVGRPQKPGQPANPNSEVCFVENATGKTIQRIGFFPTNPR